MKYVHYHIVHHDGCIQAGGYRSLSRLRKTWDGEVIICSSDCIIILKP